MFRKNTQPLRKIFLYNIVSFFEGRISMRSNNVLGFFKDAGADWYFLKKNDLLFLKKNKFFFKNSNFNCTVSSVYTVSKRIDVSSDELNNNHIFLRNYEEFIFTDNFNILLYFGVFNCSLIEIYKINLLLFFKISLL